jgi:uncharacterized membrane protein
VRLDSHRLGLVIERKKAMNPMIPLITALAAAGAAAFGRQYYLRRRGKLSTVEASIGINVPAVTAYNQWTQFEEFPCFMEGVLEVKQLSDSRLHWRAKVGSVEKEWDARITEQIPEQRIAWHSTSGPVHCGVVTFQPLSEYASRVHVRMQYDPEGFFENVGDAVGAMSWRVRGDLLRFKEFLETRGTETGAWRKEIPAP